MLYDRVLDFLVHLQIGIMKKLYYIPVILLLILSESGCKKYPCVNKDRNDPSDAQESLLPIIFENVINESDGKQDDHKQSDKDLQKK